MIIIMRVNSSKLSEFVLHENEFSGIPPATDLGKFQFKESDTFTDEHLPSFPHHTVPLCKPDAIGPFSSSFSISELTFVQNKTCMLCERMEDVRVVVANPFAIRGQSCPLRISSSSRSVRVNLRFGTYLPSVQYLDRDPFDPLFAICPLCRQIRFNTCVGRRSGEY